MKKIDLQSLGWRVPAITLLGVVSSFGNPPSATSQTTLPPDVTLPPEPTDLIEKDIPTPTDTPAPIIEQSPPEVSDPNPDSQTSDEPSEPIAPNSEGFFLKKVEVLGNTVLSDELELITKTYENRQVTFEDLLTLRTKITQLYFENGYVTSGAFLPNNQKLNDGVVQIQVVEGELERIEITGLKRLRKSYIQNRITQATQTPLNQKKLERALQLLQLDPLIAQVNAELTAGSSPGQNVLLLDVKQAPAFHAAVALDNYRSPSIGSLQGSIEVAHDNVLGFGDQFTGNYGRTEGLDLFDLSYSFPINARNGRVGVRFSKSDSTIVEDIFRDLDIRSDTETLSFNIRQPIHRTPSSEFALGLDLDARRSQTFVLDDIPFSFSPGPNEGESKVRVLRFSQDWINRSSNRVLAARSQFNFGLDIFDATVNEIGPSADFFSWQGQFQWVQRLSSRNLMIARLNTQLTPDSLLPLEKIGIGGIDTVRGYIQNQQATDNGIIGSLEFRIPLTSNPNTLQLTPFFEVGTGWNNFEPNPDPSTLASLGMGLRWQIYKGLNLRLDYGIPLISTEDRGSSLQESGLFFSVRYQPF